ncbi:MAG: aminotransferase class I/II-fold pyridoxal phosphate-dependent enzyme [Campylobacter sp.]|nr:aminotransferase class I/II-fold pyridoxal phosphate-dependent enzyme [Campylobacter sp.]
MKKETLAIRAGYDSSSAFGAMAVPIYLTTAYDFQTAEMGAKRFSLQDLGPIYTRLNNPTNDVLEKRIAELECGVAGIATSSGQSAIFGSIINLAAVGDNILVSDKIYSNVLLNNILKRFGITSKLFDAENPENLENLIDDKTKVIFFETLSNPQISVSKTKEIANIANKHGIVTVVDNTVATPILYNPIKDGVDVVVHSASKYISGQGLSLGGLVVSGKNTNKKLIDNSRYTHFNEPDETYHGLVYASVAEVFDIFTLRFRFCILRELGLTASPFNAFQLIQGLETLDVRVRRHSENALKVAKFLESHSKVKAVNYPGLENSKANSIIKKSFADGLASGLLSFEVDSFETAKKVADNTEIFSVVVNIGDSKSIITHPASTTHSQLSEEEQLRVGIKPGLIRLSIGLENADDLIEDLRKALA